MAAHVLMGGNWGNVMVIRDYASDQRLFEIHLFVDLKTEKKAKEIEAHIAHAKSNRDVEARELKKALRKQVGSLMNESIERMINAILLKPGHGGIVPQGGDWGNLMVIRDYANGQRLFEIHLFIDLETETKARDIEALLERAKAEGDVEATALKNALRAQVGGLMNESIDRMISAIVLKPGNAHYVPAAYEPEEAVSSHSGQSSVSRAMTAGNAALLAFAICIAAIITLRRKPAAG